MTAQERLEQIESFSAGVVVEAVLQRHYEVRFDTSGEPEVRNVANDETMYRESGEQFQQSCRSWRE